MKEFSFRTPDTDIYLAKYSPEECEELLEKYKADKDLEEFFRGKSKKHLYQQALKIDMLNKKGLLEKLVYLPDGKPLLKDGSYISISHSGDYIGIAHSKSVPVGLDIQLYSDKPEKILNKFASGDEISLLETLVKKNLPIYLWCAKEAVYKAAGIKGLSFKNQIKVSFKSRLPHEALALTNNSQKKYRLLAGKIEDLFLVLAEEIGL